MFLPKGRYALLGSLHLREGATDNSRYRRRTPRVPIGRKCACVAMLRDQELYSYLREASDRGVNPSAAKMAPGRLRKGTNSAWCLCRTKTSPIVFTEFRRRRSHSPCFGVSPTSKATPITKRVLVNNRRKCCTVFVNMSERGLAEGSSCFLKAPYFFLDDTAFLGDLTFAPLFRRSPSLGIRSRGGRNISKPYVWGAGCFIRFMFSAEGWPTLEKSRRVSNPYMSAAAFPRGAAVGVDGRGGTFLLGPRESSSLIASDVHIGLGIVGPPKAPLLGKSAS